MNHAAIALDLQDDLKRKVGLAILLITGLSASISTLIHYQQPDSDLSRQILPLLFAIASFGASAYLWRNASNIRLIATTILGLSVLFIFLPSFLRTIHAFVSPTISLVDIYPPLTGVLLLWPTTVLIFIPPQHRLATVSAGCLFGALPILSYLVLHPVELQSPRGLDLLLSLGPTLLIQILMVMFYSRLQVLLDKLSAERLQYYSKIIEEQAIRQEAMEQAFTQFHNGPLQSLAILLRDVETEFGESSSLFRRLAQLNTEFREVGQGLTQDPLWGDADQKGRRLPNALQNQMPLVNATLRLNPKLRLDLTLPLHRLLHDVYSSTLKRDLPYFKTIKVKVRNFHPLEDVALTVDTKRDICLWLEEALCNVGKHAQNATRVQAIGEYQNGHYCLKVQDNGIGLMSSIGKGSGDRGTKLSDRLAKRLGGTFHRESLPKGGVRCELSWPLNAPSEMNMM
ncbi:MAG: hypothetical protein F6K19_31470 [Cyanothece sp. SIO1E1]|nr:hypothetical protein [Cyanothece sp. SIO1E1]